MSSVETVTFPKREVLLEAVKAKLTEFAGMVVTLRQLYYRLVAAGVIPNNLRAYKNLGAALTKWRREGTVPMEAFEDRTRKMQEHDLGNTVNDPNAWMDYMLRQGVKNARGFYLKTWYGQPYHVVVAVEKQALEGPFAEVCEELDVDLAVCRGYPSLSFLRDISENLQKDGERDNVVLYFGDLDPSGLDIPRAVEGDLTGFFGNSLTFERPALTHEQVEEMHLIPAPVKMTDKRAEGFIVEHGTEVYELDAIEPRTLQDILRHNILRYFDESTADTRDEEIRKAKVRIESNLERLDIEGFLDKLSRGGAE